MKEHGHGPDHPLPITKVISVLLAVWLLALPLTGLLRTTMAADGTSTNTTTMLLEEEVHPAEVTCQAPLAGHGPDGERPDLQPVTNDARHISHYGEVPHQPPWC